MSFLAYLGVTQIIDQQAVQVGRGVAAALEGQPCSVYRLTAASNQSVISGSPLYNQFPIKFDRTTQKTEIEGEIFSLTCFEGLCNNNPLQNGDFVMETGYQSTGAVYCFAQYRPLKKSLFIRTETTCGIMHPTPEAGGVVAQPGSGAVWQSGYGGTNPTTSQNLVLVNGVYSLDPTGLLSPAAVPCGLQPFNRIRDGKGMAIMPTEFARTFFVMFVPLLPGYQLNENDEFKAPNQDTYIARQVFTTEQVGIVGYIVIVERKAT